MTQFTISTRLDTGPSGWITPHPMRGAVYPTFTGSAMLWVLVAMDLVGIVRKPWEARS